MPILFEAGGQILPDPQREITRLADLVSDLRRYAAGGGPTAPELATAPTLDNWAPIGCALPCLTGVVSGHPHLRGPRIVTTEIWAWAPALGWARTLSRLYRLHSRSTPDADHLAGLSEGR